MLSKNSINKITDRGIKSWVEKATPGKKYFDGGGMFLTITPAGTPAWRIKYRLNAKERLFAVGTYPAISLERAREQRDVVKAHLREGRDPVTARRVERAASATASDDSFGGVARDWLAKQKAEWSAVHYTKSSRALDRDVLPLLGKLPVTAVSTPMIASVIEAIGRRGARDTAGKVLWHVTSIFSLAQARGQCSSNPAEPVRQVLMKKKKTRHLPAVLDFAGLGEILRLARDANLSPAVHLAHRLCAFIGGAARISNIVEAEWNEFELGGSPATWVVPREKMKAKERQHDHKIFLPDVIAAELRDWRKVIGGRGKVFPSRSGEKSITRESVEKAYRVTLNLDGKHTPHGWRSAFSTLAKDHDFERDVVELALDHLHDNEVVRAYDRGERLNQRVLLMRWWGDQLERVERGADVLPSKQGADK